MYCWHLCALCSFLLWHKAVFLVVLPRSMNRRKRTGLVASPDAGFHSQLAVDSAACILCHGVQFAFKLTESFSALLCIFDQHLVTVLLMSGHYFSRFPLTRSCYLLVMSFKVVYRCWTGWVWEETVKIWYQAYKVIFEPGTSNYETGTLTTNYSATRVFAALCVIFAEAYPTRKSCLSNVNVNPFLEMK